MLESDITTLDLKYESFRIRDRPRERFLLASIRERGVLEPVSCARDGNGKLILLDGFKRIRACRSLGIRKVASVITGTDEPDSILRLIHQSNAKTLTMLEQAVFVYRLQHGFGLKAIDIAVRLERSPAWVCVRLGIFKEMSETIRGEIFAGRFPVRSYMYTIRRFTRVNKTYSQSADLFVKSVAGKGLSQRQIELLACEYFRGSSAIKKQIERGQILWTLEQLKRNDDKIPHTGQDLTEAEAGFVRDMELVLKHLQRLCAGFDRAWTRAGEFEKVTRLLADGILSAIDTFKDGLRRFYDTGQHS